MRDKIKTQLIIVGGRERFLCYFICIFIYIYINLYIYFSIQGWFAKVNFRAQLRARYFQGIL